MSANTEGIDPLKVDGIAFVLLLLALPLTSFGTTNGITALWGLGLALLVVGGIMDLATEFFLDGGR